MGRAERSPLPGSVRARLRRALTPDTARGGANRGAWIPGRGPAVGCPGLAGNMPGSRNLESKLPAGLSRRVRDPNVPAASFPSCEVSFSPSLPPSPSHPPFFRVLTSPPPSVRARRLRSASAPARPLQR